jgi:hypothetical protein
VALSGSNMRTEKQVSWSNSTSVTESNELLRKLESIETIVHNIEKKSGPRKLEPLVVQLPNNDEVDLMDVAAIEIYKYGLKCLST